MNTRLFAALAFIGVIACTCAGRLAAAPRVPEHLPPASSVTFGGSDFLHRWSKDGQHEYTPEDDDDLSRWRQMLTVNVHTAVVDGEGLAELANRVLSTYQSAGSILTTSSIAATTTAPAEHFVAAMLAGSGAVEAAFARFLLRDGVGYVVVYSRRAYGANATVELGAWIEANGEETERALMAWEGLPAKSDLDGLPEHP